MDALYAKVEKGPAYRLAEKAPQVPAVIQLEHGSKQIGDRLFKEAETLASSLNNEYAKNQRISAIIVGKLKEGANEHNNESCLVELGNVFFFSKYKVGSNSEKAYASYHKASTFYGNPTANRMLGLMLEYGLGVAENLPLALAHYSLAAEGGDYYAQCILAFKFANGLGVEPSLDVATNFYQRASAHVANQFEHNMLNQYPSVKLTNDNDYENSLARKNDALQFYIYNAERGDISAQVLLGRIFYHGSDGFAQNISLAQKYFKMAADDGNEMAKGYIGLMYAKGLFFDKNVPLAIEYCEEAAKFGSAPAFHCLGHLFETGEYSGVPDFEQAIRNYTKASERDFADAHYRLGKLLMEYIPSFSIPKSMQYLTLASRHGHVLALQELAKMNLKSSSAESKKVAITFFKNVCKRGDMNQISFLGYNAYFEGNKDYALATNLLAAACGLDSAMINAAFILDTMKSWLLAMHLWNQAAQQGYIEGYVRCGDYFYSGKLTENHKPNYEIAMKYYVKAEAEDNAEAAFNLGLMCESGKGIAIDYLMAEKYYNRSLKLNSAGYLAVFLTSKKLFLKTMFKKASSYKKYVKRIVTVVVGVLSIYFLLLSCGWLLLNHNDAQNRNSAAPAQMQNETPAALQREAEVLNLPQEEDWETEDDDGLERNQSANHESNSVSEQIQCSTGRTISAPTSSSLFNGTHSEVTFSSNVSLEQNILPQDDKNQPGSQLSENGLGTIPSSSQTVISVSHSQHNRLDDESDKDEGEEEACKDENPSDSDIEILNDFEWGSHGL